MNMESIFHLADDDTESSSAKEKVNFLNEAFYINKNICWYSEANQESR